MTHVFRGAVEVVVVSSGSKLKIRLRPAGGTPCELSRGTRLVPPFFEALGYSEDKTRFLTERILDLLLLLLLARSAPRSVRDLGYAPDRDGKLCVTEVGRLPAWRVYEYALTNSGQRKTMIRDITNHFPVKRSGPVKIDRATPRQIWIDLPPRSIRFARGAKRAALDYLRRSTIP